MSYNNNQEQIDDLEKRITGLELEAERETNPSRKVALERAIVELVALRAAIEGTTN